MDEEFIAFRILMKSETEFKVLGAPSLKGPWTTVHETDRWSCAITVYRKMVDGNWKWA